MLFNKKIHIKTFHPWIFQRNSSNTFREIALKRMIKLRNNKIIIRSSLKTEELNNNNNNNKTIE